MHKLFRKREATRTRERNGKSHGTGGSSTASLSLYSASCLFMPSPLLDCKTVGVFFSKSVKKSVKRGVRVLRGRSARASHRSLFSASFQSFNLFDCSRVLDYEKIRAVLQSTPLSEPRVEQATEQIFTSLFPQG